MNRSSSRASRGARITGLRHVLHVSDTTLGGVGRFLIDVVRHQARHGYKVSVAAPGDGWAARELVASGATLRPWRAGPRPSAATIAEMAALNRIVADVDPNLVHLHSDKAGLAGRLLLRGRRATIFQPHAWSFWAVQGLTRRGALLWERAGARWADVIICVSADERRLARDAGVAACFRVVRNGVDLAEFRPSGTAEHRASRARLGLSDVPRAVCVGRLHRQKNQQSLLDIWPQVRASVPTAELVLVGGGPDGDGLAAQSVPGVRLAGWTDDVRPWLAAASLVVQPSRWEGLSFSLLEALSCARSVVVTDVTGMREVVVPGVGAVVPLDDNRALAEAIVARLVDPTLADKEGEVGRRWVSEHNALAVQLDKLLAVYDDVLDRRRAQGLPGRGERRHEQ